MCFFVLLRCEAKLNQLNNRICALEASLTLVETKVNSVQQEPCILLFLYLLYRLRQSQGVSAETTGNNAFTSTCWCNRERTGEKIDSIPIDSISTSFRDSSSSSSSVFCSTSTSYFTTSRKQWKYRIWSEVERSSSLCRIFPYVEIWSTAWHHQIEIVVLWAWSHSYRVVYRIVNDI